MTIFDVSDVETYELLVEAFEGSGYYVSSEIRTHNSACAVLRRGPDDNSVAVTWRKTDS